MQSLNLVSYLFLSIPKLIFSIRKNNNFLFIRSHKLYGIMLSYFLYKDLNCQFKSLIDFTCVDYHLRQKRFNLIYHLISIFYHFRVFFKFSIKEFESMYSLVYIYPNISWYERECWDFFGIIFLNNKNLRRLLLDYGFVGHPLRKDFPLTGFVECVYSVFYFCVMQRKVNISQTFRRYNTKKMWNKKRNKALD
jgi:NADH-quinone oxidoreductase subunit C